MLKALFKLAIFLLAAHALFRFVPPYWNHNQFESEVKERAVTWRADSEEQVRDRVFTLAQARGLPLTREQITVRRDPHYLFVDVGYSRRIEFFPTWKYEWKFESDVTTLMAAPLDR